MASCKTKTTEAPALRRELKARHLTMIAYRAQSVQVFSLPPGQPFRQSVWVGHFFLYPDWPDGLLPDDQPGGELAAYMPASGSFSTYGQKYVEEGFGFALGWFYWYN